MSQETKNRADGPQVIQSSKDYFEEMVAAAIENRRVRIIPQTQSYLVNLLEHYVPSRNLFDEDDQEGVASNRRTTLAETLLQAASAALPVKIEMLKKLGDMSLYVSGFFGDSLHRKVIDIDYYAEIGGTAYGTLASCTADDISSRVFTDLSSRFMDYMEILTFISQQALIQTDADLLRLYNRYVMTGSKLAEEQLIQKGVLTPARANKTRQ